MPVTTITLPRPPSNHLMLEDDRQLTQPWRQYFDKLAQTLSIILPDATTGTYPHGIIDGSSAPAGDIGEVLETSTTSPTVLVGATPADVLTLDLTPGDWDVAAWAAFAVGGGGPADSVAFGIDSFDVNLPGGTAASISAWTGPQRHNVTTLTTVTLRVRAEFSPPATVQASGRLRARRMR